MDAREKGDVSKARDYLPVDKQYLITRGVPCLRRATALAYTDADEDAERLLAIGDLSSTGSEADEWVETHTGRPSAHDSAGNAGVIDDIPDLDGAGDVDHLTGGIGRVSLSGNANTEPTETPDLDDIPDIEEELEEGDDEATAAPPKLTNEANDTACVTLMSSSFFLLPFIRSHATVTLKWQKGIYFKCELTTL